MGLLNNFKEMKHTLILLLFSCAAWGQTAEDYYNSGSVASESGYLKDAIIYYTAAIELNPKYAEAYCDRCAAKYDLNKRDLNMLKEAIEDCNRAIELNPKYADAYYNRGICKYMMENYIAAIEDYKRAFELNPKDKDFERMLKKAQKKVAK